MHVAVAAPRFRHFSIIGWRNIRDIDTEDALLGVHIAKLPPDTLNLGDTIEFTLYWPESGKWEGGNFEVAIEGFFFLSKSNNHMSIE